MNTEQEQMELVKKLIAKQIWSSGEAANRSVIGYKVVYPRDTEYDDLLPEVKEYWEIQADNLLRLTDSNGNRLLAVIHPDQTPLGHNFGIVDYSGHGDRDRTIFYETQNSMKFAGWKRVIEEQNK